MPEKTQNVEITFSNVRLSYPKLFKPEPFKKNGVASGEPRFGASFLIPKSNKALVKKIDDAIDDAIFNEWGDKPPRLPDDKIPFQDGDETDLEKNPANAGQMILTAYNRRAPTVVHSLRDETKQKRPFIRLDGSEGVIYAGCRVNVTVRFYTQTNQSGWGNRVNCSLENVQFFKDDEPFGQTGTDADEAFDGMENEDVDAKDFRSREGGDDDRGGRRSRGGDETSDRRSNRADDSRRPAEDDRRGRSDDRSRASTGRDGVRGGRDNDRDAAPSRRGSSGREDTVRDTGTRRRRSSEADSDRDLV